MAPPSEHEKEEALETMGSSSSGSEAKMRLCGGRNSGVPSAALST